MSGGLRDTRRVSRENVEIVRRVYEAAGRRDAALVLSLYDREVELDSTRLEIADDSGGSSGAMMGCSGSFAAGMRRGRTSSTTTTS